MSKFIRKTYHCELLTPMIMSGADQSKAELRAPSIKGALRWWWRALQPEMGHEELRRKEFNIFGGVFGEAREQKSKCAISINWQGETPRPFALSFSQSRSYAKYLAYGAIGDNQTPPRKAFPEGSIFIIKTKTETRFAEEVHTAMATALKYGGFGMKNKNGFGQVHCKESSIAPPSSGDRAKFASFTSNWESWSAGDSFRTHQAAHDAVASAYYWAKNPNERNHGRESIQGSGEINLFAGHSPGQFGLERKAKPIQLFVNKIDEKRFSSGILSFPYQLETSKNSRVPAPGGKGEVSPSKKRHHEIVLEFMENVKSNNENS